jgi:glyoxylase-like metal-dependent hydrolase (beta-lactamase superfamily II)
VKPARFAEAKNGTAIGGELEVIEIGGAVAGEIALYHASNGGTLIVGDALINFEPYGFTFLPRKYCLDEKQMRSSLHQFFARPAERMIFAHGMPILSGATARLRQLLNADH